MDITLDEICLYNKNLLNDFYNNVINKNYKNIDFNKYLY